MKKRRRKYLILAAILIALPMLYLVEERVRGEWLLAGYKKELIARGERLTIEELIPPLPEGTNVLLLTPDEAETMLNIGGWVSKPFPSSIQVLSPGKAVVWWRRDGWFDKAGRVHTWDEYRQAAAATLASLPQLRQQLTNRVLRVRLDYSEGCTSSFSYQHGLLMEAPALDKAAIYDLHAGNLNGAVENLHAQMRLIELLDHQLLLVDQMLRYTRAAGALKTTWEALQADGWADAQLALLQRDWEAVQLTATMVRTLGMERAMNREYFPGGRNFSREYLRANLESYGGGLGGGNGGGTSSAGGGLDQWIAAFGDKLHPVLLKARIEFWSQVWATQDQRLYLEAIQELIDLGRDALAKHDFRPLVSLGESGTNLFGRRLLLKRLEAQPRSDLPHLGTKFFAANDAVVLAECARRDAWTPLTVTAIALKRFHLRHGHWPESLAELVPAFLPEVPFDWMDGRPLRYCLKADGAYLLYSVGADGIDQGGDPERTAESRVSWEGKDYVWPQPATTEEVDAANEEFIAEHYQNMVWLPIRTPTEPTPEPDTAPDH